MLTNHVYMVLRLRMCHCLLFVPSSCGQDQLEIYFYTSHSLTVCSYILLFSDLTSICETVHLNVTWLKVYVISQFKRVWNGTFITYLQSIAPIATRGTKKKRVKLFTQRILFFSGSYFLPYLCKSMQVSVEIVKLFAFFFEDYFMKSCRIVSNRWSFTTSIQRRVSV
jgi:hypothetical protein